MDPATLLHRLTGLDRRRYLTPREALAVTTVALALLGVSWVARRLLGEIGTLIGLALAVGLVLAALVAIDRQNRRERADRFAALYRQIESLLALYSWIEPVRPLPEIGGFAALPDFLRLVADVAAEERPGLVVEAGSGVSTVVIAYCLRKLGGGRLVALEHDPIYAAATREALAKHDLEDLAMVVDAPLRKVEVGGRSCLWYDTDAISLEQPIDLLVVDGPPGGVHPMARYPAVPLLYDRLRDGATIVLDDADRIDERRAIEDWQRQHAGLMGRHVATQKGAWVARAAAPGP